MKKKKCENVASGLRTVRTRYKESNLCAVIISFLGSDPKVIVFPEKCFLYYGRFFELSKNILSYLLSW